jgi:hypothetical protein
LIRVNKSMRKANLSHKARRLDRDRQSAGARQPGRLLGGDLHPVGAHELRAGGDRDVGRTCDDDIADRWLRRAPRQAELGAVQVQVLAVGGDGEFLLLDVVGKPNTSKIMPPITLADGLTLFGHSQASLPGK